MSHPTTPQSPTAAAAAGQSPKQHALSDYCRMNNIRPPSWQLVSDRRGGRTAWSCTVQIAGQHVAARYWYDGQYVNNAREDAAEQALQMLGQVPAPSGSQPAHYQQRQPKQQQRPAYGTGAVGN